MSEYFDNLCHAMELCAEHPRTMFVGQAVQFPGTAMFTTLKNVPMEKRLEFPVAEDLQLGFCTGMSLNGEVPICIYPRINFLLLAINQLVLHLDKLPIYSKYRPRVIIRTAVATDNPMDPGPQHLGDFIESIYRMLDTVVVYDLRHSNMIVPVYRGALKSEGSSLIVEHTELYGLS
jgi:pyruvate/2-oxoglutarate/acetoin dehydrogenase E1 component